MTTAHTLSAPTAANTAALARHLVPEYRPPSTGGLAGPLLLSTGGLHAALAVLAFAVGNGWAGAGLLVVAAPLLALAVMARRGFKRRRATYDAMHKGAVAMAERLASGKQRVGETTEGLQRLAREVEGLSAPPAGGWFFIVFWSGE